MISRLESGIETNLVKVEENTVRIRELDENVTTDKVISKNQSSRISKLEEEIPSVEDAMQNQIDEIIQLRMNMQAQNASYFDDMTRLEDIESKQNHGNVSVLNR